MDGSMNSVMGQPAIRYMSNHAARTFGKSVMILLRGRRYSCEGGSTRRGRSSDHSPVYQRNDCWSLGVDPLLRHNVTSWNRSPAPVTNVIHSRSGVSMSRYLSL